MGVSCCCFPPCRTSREGMDMYWEITISDNFSKQLPRVVGIINSISQRKELKLRETQ